MKILDEIANTASKNEKIELLKDYAKKYPLIKKVFYYAYSPTFVYGLKKVAPINVAWRCAVGMNDWNYFFSLLHQLHNRELTGNDAKNAVNEFISYFEEDAQQVFCNIIKGDLRCGMNAASINKAIPKLIELPPPYMRCSLLKDVKNGFEDEPHYSQVKADGMYANLLISSEKITALTRAGNEFPLSSFKPEYAELLEHSKKIQGNGFWHSGEIVMTYKGEILDRKTSNGITNSLMKGGTIDFNDYGFVFYAWDAIPFAKFVNKGKYDVPYCKRLKQLQDDFENLSDTFQVIETVIVNSAQGAKEHYDAIKERGLEGTVRKRMNMPWADGTSKDQIKVKTEADVDLRIVGLKPGEGKNASTFGSIEMVSECGMLEVAVSGMSDDLRKEIYDNFKELYCGTIATVTGNDLITKRDSPIASIFLPRLKELRADKNVADDLERIREIFESIK